jgi:TPR repeat protein
MMAPHPESVAASSGGNTEHSGPQGASSSGSRELPTSSPGFGRWIAIAAVAAVAGALAIVYTNRQASAPVESQADASVIGEALMLAKQKDFDKSNQLLRPLAEKGVARAQYDLGVSYETGTGDYQDYPQAAAWYRKAAQQGYAPAQAAIGSAYLNGQGVSKDSREAVKWLRNAADQGDIAGEYLLGVAYADGEGVGKDGAQAMKLFSRAAAQGDTDSMTAAGTMYVNGDGVAADTSRGMALIRKAADLGSGKAQDALGQVYYQGIGVERDFSLATAWFKLSAEQGNAHAKSALQEMAQAQKRAASEQRQASMDYVQRYAEAYAGGLLHGGACDALGQMIIRISNNTQMPENVRMLQIDALTGSAQRARCEPD